MLDIFQKEHTARKDFELWVEKELSRSRIDYSSLMFESELLLQEGHPVLFDTIKYHDPVVEMSWKTYNHFYLSHQHHMA